MRFLRRLWWGTVIVLLVAALILSRSGWRRHIRFATHSPIPDRSLTSPLNQPGGGAAPGDAYEVYSALYQTPLPEPLIISQDSVTDIPQLDGSCLRPSTPSELEMTQAFEAANRQSHRWEPRFTLPGGYRLVSRPEAGRIQSCLDAHGAGGPLCAPYAHIAHVRFLGVPGFDSAHTHALVSIIRMCGNDCGSGGIFVVEKAQGTWRRAETSSFTSNCSWMYQGALPAASPRQ